MIETRNLSVTYKPSCIRALSNITISIPPNTVTCVIGPNASGKSTLLKAISNIIDYEGLVLIENIDSRKIVSQLRKILSFTQGIDRGLDYLGSKVIDVLFAARYPVSKGFIETQHDLEVINQVARELGIVHLLNRRIGELSSGELQKVVLAIAIVKKPRFILLDEPDNHIDAVGKAFLSNYLRSMSRDTTIIISTHDVVFGLYTCDYFVVLSGGKVIFQGWYKELLDDPSPIERSFGIRFLRVSLGSRGVLVPVYLPGLKSEHISASEIKNAESSSTS